MTHGPAPQPGVGERVEVPLPLGLWLVALLLVVGGVGFIMAVFDIGPAFLAGGLIGMRGSQVGQAAVLTTGVAMVVSDATFEASCRQEMA